MFGIAFLPGFALNEDCLGDSASNMRANNEMEVSMGGRNLAQWADMNKQESGARVQELFYDQT